MSRKPEILNKTLVAESRLFAIEALELRFSNGEERIFERFRHRGQGAVMIAPLLDDDTILLIREYAAGLNSYELTLPKGLIDPGETETEAGNRELMEEVGYGANSISIITSLATAPGYMGHRVTLLLAQDLYEQRLSGDEPEEIEVVPWSLSDLPGLFARDDISDARTIAALYIIREMVYNGK